MIDQYTQLIFGVGFQTRSGAILVYGGKTVIMLYYVACVCTMLSGDELRRSVEELRRCLQYHPRM